ncbi:MAG TPA: M67 family metallopeptidase [Solirubrobacteraceae bacterium]|jgi:proteasome lid subunit RPN8/RPN11|nr:M67 family metallopeptidase [Solirubrobacteraceae bacterium]
MLTDAALLDEVIAHARAEYDAECCGMIAYAQSEETGVGSRDDAGDLCGAAVGVPHGDEGGAWRAVRVHPARNVFAGRKDAGGADLGRKRFEIDGKEVLRVTNEIDDADLKLGAIYHSHTHTEPYPSQTDINFAAHWPDVEWVIVGLAQDEPEVRCYLIEEGVVKEVPLEVR